jgi:hypothetical protein
MILKENLKKEIFSFSFDKANKDETRLILSASFVFLVLSLLIGHLFTKNLLWRLLGSESNLVEIEQVNKNKKIYEVLLEQEFTNKQIKDEIKALSNEDSAGTGGLTEKMGFHSASPFYEFIFGGMPSSNSQLVQKSKEENKSEDEIYEIGVLHQDPIKKNLPVTKQAVSNPSVGQETKIPFNYRFQQDFQFRWDGSSQISIPRQKLAGYEYFKHMIKKIEQSFAPPGGGNFAYRDHGGTVIHQGINPGETKISFLLNDDGQVIDVKQMSTQGQTIVDRACMDAIKGQNFGKVPEEVKKQGMIIGINFVFVGYMGRR